MSVDSFGIREIMPVICYWFKKINRWGYVITLQGS